VLEVSFNEISQKPAYCQTNQEELFALFEIQKTSFQNVESGILKKIISGIRH
jgi:hypothetical protein